MINSLNKYQSHLISICQGVRAACLHTVASADETPPRSWRTGSFPSGPEKTFLREATCTDVLSTGATSGRSLCSTQ